MKKCTDSYHTTRGCCLALAEHQARVDGLRKQPKKGLCGVAHAAGEHACKLPRNHEGKRHMDGNVSWCEIPW